MTLKISSILSIPPSTSFGLHQSAQSVGSLAKDTTSGIHEDRTAKKFKGTKETNGTATAEGDAGELGGLSVGLLYMASIWGT
jgi:hypothetical protein